MTCEVNLSEVRRGGHFVPVLFIEAPQGIRPEKKSVMMRKITEAVDEAYHIGDTLIFLREYAADMLPWMEDSSRRTPRSLRLLIKMHGGI